MIFLGLLSVFAFLSASEGALSTDLSSVSDLITKLEGFLPDLEKISKDRNSPNSNEAKQLITDIEGLRNSDVPFKILVSLITTSFRVKGKKNTPVAEINLVSQILAVTIEILGKLPKEVTGFDNVPPLLVILVARLTDKGKINKGDIYDPLAKIGLYGLDDGSNTKTDVKFLIEALSLIVGALTTDLPNKLKPAFEELNDVLKKFVAERDGIDEQDILDSLSELVTAVKNYSGDKKTDAVALAVLIIRVLKPLLRYDPTTTSELENRESQLKLRNCGLLVPAVLCLVNGLLAGLMGDGGGSTGENGLGGILGRILGLLG